MHKQYTFNKGRKKVALIKVKKCPLKSIQGGKFHPLREKLVEFISMCQIYCKYLHCNLNNYRTLQLL